jgi:hypothetical protein
MVQAEKHMRVRLGAKERFESLVTCSIFGANPGRDCGHCHAAQRLQFSSCAITNLTIVWNEQGGAGGTHVANIIIDTLDSLSFREGKLQTFVVKATSYFEALFAQGLYKDRIQNARPLRLRDDGNIKTFGETFKDAHIYVTHFIKVYDYSVLNNGFIMALATRDYLCRQPSQRRSRPSGALQRRTSEEDEHHRCHDAVEEAMQSSRRYRNDTETIPV